MKYEVDLVQTVSESTRLYVEAHNQEQAELIAQYIAENGKDPWDRLPVDVTWRPDRVVDDAAVISCEVAMEGVGIACNTLPEHTEGLFSEV
jgi:hypothetical protein